LIPSQTFGMRKFLSKHFVMEEVVEANTTRTCSRCHQKTMEPCMRRPYPNKKKEKKLDRMIDVRGLRHCQNEECKVFVNRDYNAAINIRNNLLYFIEHGLWDPLFSRDSDQNENESTTEEEDETLKPTIKGSYAALIDHSL